MARIKVNGIDMEIPDSVTTTEELLQMSQADPEDVGYQLDNYGSQTVLAPGQEVEVKDGDRFGTVSRFRTGGH